MGAGLAGLRRRGGGGGPVVRTLAASAPHQPQLTSCLESGEAKCQEREAIGHSRSLRGEGSMWPPPEVGGGREGPGGWWSRWLERTGGAGYPGQKPPFILALTPVSLSVSLCAHIQTSDVTSPTCTAPPSRVQPSIAHPDPPPPPPWRPMPPRPPGGAREHSSRLVPLSSAQSSAGPHLGLVSCCCRRECPQQARIISGSGVRVRFRPPWAKVSAGRQALGKEPSPNSDIGRL